MAYALACRRAGRADGDGIPADAKVLEAYEAAGFQRAVHWLSSAPRGRSSAPWTDSSKLSRKCTESSAQFRYSSTASAGRSRNDYREIMESYAKSA